ncbi:hypothetical protein BDV36DRAFT_283216 [Aspergillus pseudocaelatus]|uniref:Calycin-like protein n=1 Tax=Aspergillus pseudocaelatus TaxID=1825620 RepID=A0ABQ6WLT2_9EURO|nr:hypothetical protein BDV36DRAFT_283216 [Aspergillus pseudocaelatus]
MAYVFEKLLDPPQTPLTTNIPDSDPPESESERIPEHFDGHLSAGWKVVYRQDFPKHEKIFLCSNWAYVRLKNDIHRNETFPYSSQPPDETTDYTVDEYVKKLDKEYQLVECDFNDPKRICVIWSPGRSPRSVGHIQVKYNGNWESKISTEYWVITHGEDDFEHLTNGNLKKMKAFKRK